MSLRAELLRLSLRTVKTVKATRKRRDVPVARIRRRLALIEPIVPRPPGASLVAMGKLPAGRTAYLFRGFDGRAHIPASPG